MKTGCNRALGKKAHSVQVRAKFLAWQHAKTLASSSVIEKTGGCYQQETVKRFTQGLNLKRILETGPCCTSAPVSPLCRILDGRSMMFVCEREELSKK